MQQHSENDTDLESRAIISADQYAQYQRQRVAHRRNQRSGCRPKA
ncbi:hypothetical protein [Hymenobacter algoricola]